MNQTFTPEMRRQKMTEKLWLYYFNDVLCEKGSSLRRSGNG